jgi:uncharacterized protein YkwD
VRLGGITLGARATAVAALLLLAIPGSASAGRVGHANVHGHAACGHARQARRYRSAHREGSSRSCVASLRVTARTAVHRRHLGAARVSAAARRAAERAAAIARVLATQCENTQLTPDASNVAAVSAAVVCLINHERALDGELPLSVDSRLQAAAESHASEMISLDYFAHVSPSGLTPVQRIRATGYIPGPEFGFVIGENLAWGTLTLSTPQAIVEAWMASPEHRANILEGRYADTGVAVAPSVPASLSGGSPGATYAQEFGVVIA